MSRRGIAINPARFRAIRKKALLTQEELAIQADCSVDLIQKAERRGTSPRVDSAYLEALLQVLGASLSDVIAETEVENIALTNEWVSLTEQGDLDGLEKLFSPDIRYEIPGPPVPLGDGFEPVTDGVYVGWPMVRAALTTVFSITADRKIDVCEIHAVEDWVYLEWTFKWYAVALSAYETNHVISKMRFLNGQVILSRSMTAQPLPSSQDAVQKLRQMQNLLSDVC